MIKENTITYTPIDDAGVGFVAESAADLNIGIDGECPICAKLRDPVSGALPYNVKAIAAMEEARAMIRGEIPSKRYKPYELEQVLKEMQEDITNEKEIIFAYTGTHSDYF